MRRALLGFDGAVEQLGFEPVPAPPPKPEHDEPADRHEPATDLPQVEAVPMRFWRQDEVTFTDLPDQALSLPEPAELNAADLSSAQRSVFATPRSTPLAAWSRLWPALRASLQAYRPGRDPDLGALVRAWGRGQVLRRIPRVQRRAWAGRASVWIDRSEALVPFWSDQLELAHRLGKVCGKSGIDLRFVDGRALSWALGQHRFVLPGFRPDPAMPVLVLGDLGSYGTETERLAWLRTGTRLRCARRAPRRSGAGSPPARMELAVAEAWCAIPWERGRLGVMTVVREEASFWQAAGARLLRLASPASLVQPGLLRALRLLLPAGEADAATEADVWNHAEVSERDATAYELDHEASCRLRQAFAEEETDALKAKVSETLRRWHEGLPAELLSMETVVWHGLLPSKAVAAPSDPAKALAFLSRLLGSSQRDDVAPQLAEALRRYERKQLRSIPGAVFKAVPDLGLLWAVAFKNAGPEPVPEGVDPVALETKLGRYEKPGWWALRQAADRLVFWPAASGAWLAEEGRPGSPVGLLWAAGSTLEVTWGREEERLRLDLAAGLSLPLREEERLQLATVGCAMWLKLEAASPGQWRRGEISLASGPTRTSKG